MSPRINIYVPDELKARLDENKNQVKWSEVAQKAFERELDELSRIKGDEFEAVVRRLRRLKQESEGEWYDEGRSDGREHAANWADWYGLVRFSRWYGELDQPASSVDYARHALDFLGYEEYSCYDYCDEWEKEARWRGFADGVLEVFNAVKDKV